MKYKTATKLHQIAAQLVTPIQRRHIFFGLFRHAFNDVDRDRLRAVGPDRLCAEWMLKNGGAVRLGFRQDPIVDYNDLPPDTHPIEVLQLDATRSSVTAAGLSHLRGCNHINRMVLNDCPLLENGAMEKLQVIVSSLQVLQVSNCPGIKDSGLLQVGELSNLRKLCCFNLVNVKDIEYVEQQIINKLPYCQILRESEQEQCECEARN